MALADNPVWLAHLFALALTGTAQAVLAVWIYRRKWDQRGATAFVALTLSGLAWIAAETVLVAATDPAIEEAAYLFGSFWATVTTAAFVVFASQYANAEVHRNRLVQAALGGTIVAYAVLAPTNHAHHLLFEPFAPQTDPFPYLMYERGPVFGWMVVVLSVLALYSIYRMGRYLLSTGRQARTQLALLMAGALSLLVLEVFSSVGLLPLENYNYTAYGLLPFNLFVALAVFRFRLFDVQPIARSSVVENLRDPVLVLDGDRNIVDFNRASRHVWPDIDEGVGAPFATACPELEGHVDFQPTESRPDGGLVLPYGDQDRYYSVTVSTVHRGTDVDDPWYSILLRDVTALERSRRQLEAQNERLDQVASTMSHDLRNPIQVAQGRVDMLRRELEALDVPAGDRDSLLEYLETTERSLDRMEAILTDVLAIAREGKTVDETVLVSFADAANEAWGNVETYDATLQVEGDRAFAADRSKLLTIFENLFRNSLDHGPKDVTVTVGPRDDGFYVEDDGPGIAADVAEDVFEYGYTTRSEGTGIGLSLVRTMAESHGWTVRVDDAYVDGARFVFEHVSESGDATVSGEESPA